MRNFFRHFAKDESGMGVVEVILIIVVLIGLVVSYISAFDQCVCRGYLYIYSEGKSNGCLYVWIFSYKGKLPEGTCRYVSYLCYGSKIQKEIRN